MSNIKMGHYAQIWYTVRRDVVRSLSADITRIITNAGGDSSLVTQVTDCLRYDTVDSPIIGKLMTELKTRRGLQNVLCVDLPECGKIIDKIIASNSGGLDIENVVAAFNEAAITFHEFNTLVGGALRAFILCHNLVNDPGDLLALRGAFRVVAGRLFGIVRQLSFLFYKLELPYSDDTLKTAYQRFLDNDDICEYTNSMLCALRDKKTIRLTKGEFMLRRVLRLARVIVTRCTRSIDPKEIIPRHGPGVVATGERPWEKSQFKRWYPTLNGYYPFDEYFMYSPTHVAMELEVIKSLEGKPAPVAKLASVPKDSRGPRLIACEPLETQWIQQGLMAAIVPHLESDRNWCQRRVNFTDQSINQDLARRSSINGRWVTLDMKDASDLVSLELVKELFASTRLLGGLLAARSSRIELPGKVERDLHKYASMGSALCFPVESLVFFAVAVAGICVEHSLKPHEAREHVYVYGDDLVISTPYYRAVVEHLHSVGLTVNLDKCCTGDSFRESCGVDAYRGIDVTPLRFKRPLSVPHHSTRMSPGDLVAWTSYCNSLYDRGYVDAALEVASRLVRLIPDKIVWYLGEIVDISNQRFPWEKKDLCLVLRFDASIVGVRRAPMRWNRKGSNSSRYQSWEILTHTIQVPLRGANESGWSQMLMRLTPPKYPTEPGKYPYVRGMRLKRTWLAVV